MNEIAKKILSLPPEKRELFEMMLLEKGVDPGQVPILPRTKSEQETVLSYAQQRLWFLDRLEPDNPLYNICMPVKINGLLNKDALQKTLQWIADRHTVLKTVFVEKEGKPFQKLKKDFRLTVEWINADTADGQKIDDLVQEESRRPFDLATGPLIRARVLGKSESEHIVILTLHHIVSDNWSTGLLIREFVRAYPVYAAGDSPKIEPLAIQYADFAAWQRKWISGKTLEKQLDYWEQQLSGSEGLLEMPWDFNRPDFQTYNGNFLNFTLDEAQTTALKKLAEEHDVTLFMVLTALYGVLLQRYSASEDIPIGTPIANRNRSETEELIGFFINTLVLRCQLDSNPSFSTLLQRVKETTLGAFDHQDVPFESVVERIDPPRETNHTPLFQNMIVLNNAPLDSLTLPGLEMQLLDLENSTSKFDLIFNFIEKEGRLEARVEYNTDLYKEHTISRMIAHFQRICEHVLENPATRLDEISLLSGDEKKLLLSDWAVSERKAGDTLLLDEVLKSSAATYKEKAAVKTSRKTLTYNELLQQRDACAALLQTKNIKPGDVVAVLAGRTPGLISAMLGIMRYGAVYLPLDPDYPQERLRYMLEDSGARLIIGGGAYNALAAQIGNTPFVALEEIEAKPYNGATPVPEMAAYIIYTSGTSGRPKGVTVSHATLSSHMLDMAGHFELNDTDVVLQFAAVNFDASLEQMLPGLCVGATVFLRDDDVWPVTEFLDKINEHGLTVVNPPTAYWQQWTAQLARQENVSCPPQLRLVIAGGDTMAPDVLQRWQASPLGKVKLLNAYGPTETCITATTFDATNYGGDKGRSRVPIGRPCAARNVYVLDKAGKPLPAGFAGELYIGGTNLAMGYHKKAALTAQQFVVDPFLPGEQARMYKTGDRVRFNEEAQLEFLGRVDEQVKIRGFRIEPAEIEHRLRACTGISDALVMPRSSKTGEKVLVAWCVVKDKNISIPDLRKELKKDLPDYMIPAAFSMLDGFPQTPAGKIDKKALPMPEDVRSQLSSEFVAPRTETEKALAEIVANILKLEKVGIYDNFFELGGHSMLGTQVVSQIRDTFDVELPLRVLFEKPTVDGIASAITAAMTENVDEEELAGMLDDMSDLSDDELNALLNED